MEKDIKMAEVDFECLSEDCEGVVAFNLGYVRQEGFQVICGECHKSYEFDSSLKEKLDKLAELIASVRKAEEILGDCNVAVTVPGGTVRIPYALLLTRLNTMITLKVGNKDVDFHFRVEPSAPDTFR